MYSHKSLHVSFCFFGQSILKGYKVEEICAASSLLLRWSFGFSVFDSLLCFYYLIWNRLFRFWVYWVPVFFSLHSLLPFLPSTRLQWWWNQKSFSLNKLGFLLWLGFCILCRPWAVGLVFLFRACFLGQKLFSWLYLFVAFSDLDLG